MLTVADSTYIRRKLGNVPGRASACNEAVRIALDLLMKRVVNMSIHFCI